MLGLNSISLAQMQKHIPQKDPQEQNMLREAKIKRAKELEVGKSNILADIDPAAENKSKRTN